VIHLAAKVGGLFANMADKVNFYESNIQINSNVIKACDLIGVKRLICVLSTCIFPDKVESYPIQETFLHQGPPHPSNEGYAMAKRMCEVQCRLYN
jgi:GDP-L-fucose synthase